MALRGLDEIARADVAGPDVRRPRRSTINISIPIAIGDPIVIRDERLLYLGRTRDGRLAFSMTRLPKRGDPADRPIGDAVTVFYDEVVLFPTD